MSGLVTGLADEFGSLLRRHRRAADISQEELAHLSGVSARAISDMERGVARGPQQRTVEAIGAALGLTDKALDAFLLAARKGRQRKTSVKVGLCELPRPNSELIGRTAELGWIEELVEGIDAGDGHAGTIGVIHSQAGMGKTTLVVSAGERLSSRFGGRVFFLDLRGADEQPLSAAVALERLLRTLGVPEPALPLDTNERASLFRCIVAKAPTMIVLDNAHDEAQVRPLLARSASCLQLITSRRALSGLESVQRLELGVLDPEASSLLLSSAAGGEVDSGAAAEVAALCGYLPLALRIVGNRVSARRPLVVGHLVSLLRDQRYRLSMLTSGDRQVRAAFEVSYGQLSDSARRMFRRLSLIPQREFGEELAAVVCSTDRLDTIMTLEELLETSMVIPSEHDLRYQFHDLLRLFARERLEEEEPEQDREAAMDALCEWALERMRVSGDAVGAESCDDEAMRWLDLEVGCWLHALEHEAARGNHKAVSSAARAVHWYADMRMLRVPWEHVYALALKSARAARDLSDEAAILTYASWGQWIFQGALEEAITTLKQSIDVAREADDRELEGWALIAMSVYSQAEGKPDDAVAHATAAVEIFTDLGQSLGRLAASVTRGMVYEAQGMFERAVAVRRELIAELQRRKAGRSSDYHSMMLAASCRSLGDDLQALGDWEESLAAYTTSASVSEGAGRWTDYAMALKGQGEVLLHLGRVSEAVDVLTEALRVLSEQIGQQAAVAAVQRLLDGVDEQQCVFEAPRAEDTGSRA